MSSFIFSKRKLTGFHLQANFKTTEPHAEPRKPRSAFQNHITSTKAKLGSHRNSTMAGRTKPTGQGDSQWQQRPIGPPPARNGKTAGSTNNTSTRPGHGVGLIDIDTTIRSSEQSPSSRLVEVPDSGVPPNRRTAAELAATRKAQEPWKRAFRRDHPGDYVRVSTSGEGLLCAWRALEASWNAAIPRIVRATRLPEASLRGMVTVDTLQETLARDRHDPDSNLKEFGVVAVRDFTVDHAARIFSQLVKNRTGLAMELGWIGPLQQSAFGGNKNDLAYVLLGGPSEGNEQSAPAVCRLWIWNNNEPRAGHYEGIRDAPAGVLPYF